MHQPHDILSGPKLCGEQTSARKAAFFALRVSFSWRDNHKWIFSEVRNTVTSACKDYKVSLLPVLNTSTVPHWVKNSTAINLLSFLESLPFDALELGISYEAIGLSP